MLTAFATQKATYRRATGENRFPCLCDLVNNVAAIEGLDRELGRQVEHLRANQPERLRIDVVEMQGWVSQQIRAGELQGGCWLGESWKEKITPFLRYFDECIEVLCIGKESRLTLYELYRQIFGVIGSARILEEAIEVAARGQRAAENSLRHLNTILGSTFEPNLATFEDQDGIKIIADSSAAANGIYIQTASRYKMSLVLKPFGSWGARLNSAACRLRFSNSGSQFHELVIPFLIIDSY